MSMKSHNYGQILKVMLWGIEIGQLHWDEQKRLSYFFFSPEYFRQPYDLTPITCPKDSPEARFAIFGNNDDKIYQKLPPFLADFLPDKWGNDIFDRWFEENNYKNKDKTPLTKLSFIGKTSMGALEFIPELNAGYKISRLNMSELYLEAKKFEEQLSGRFISPGIEILKSAILALGTSPGGSKSKAIIAQRPDGTYVSGKTSIDPQNKHYIIKFNDPDYSFSEIEMTYQQMATLSGIQMMPSKLERIEGINHFLTERFDRVNGEKIMMQTLAAINPCDETYEELFRTCRLLNIDAPQQEEMFRRMAFNFLTNNTDDHRKNFSFLMDKKGKWEISPAYDLMFIFERGNKPNDYHCMSLKGKHTDVSLEDLLEFADKQGIKNARNIIDKIVVATKEFNRLANQNGIRTDIAEYINNRLLELRPKDCLELVTPTKTELPISNGLKIRDIRFERSEKGNIHILGEYESLTVKYILRPKTDDYDNILKDGFNNMSVERKKHYAEKYLVTKIKKPVFPKIDIPKVTTKEMDIFFDDLMIIEPSELDKDERLAYILER